MGRSLAILLGAGLVIAALAAGASASVHELAGPVRNGDFELPPVTRTTELAVQGSPLDRCFGIGHQADYGTDTPQAEATGGPFGEPDPNQASPFGALETIVQDPEGTADQQTACVWNAQDGRDIAHLHPAAMAMTPAGWTVDIAEPSVVFGYGFDGDVTDREAQILADGDGANRNLWQVFDPVQHAYTPNARALAITVEAGSISDRAKVDLELEPANTQAPVSGEWGDCVLTFNATQLQTALQDAAGDRLLADPANASLDAKDESCQQLETTWSEAEGDEERRDVLAQTRIVEISFWDWNVDTTEATVIDDVALLEASTLAEEITSDASFES